MKILLLSCNTGAGHNSAASAVMKRLTECGHECEMTDGLAFFSKTVSAIVSASHILLYRKFPRLFGSVYRHNEKGTLRSVYNTVRPGASSLNKKIVEGGFDAIVCTHLFAAMIATEFRRRYNRYDIKLYFIVTDYTDYPGIEQIESDAIFTPHALLKDDFAKRGVSGDILVPTGIPISEQFFEKVDKLEARQILSLPEKANTLLISSGSMGAGPVAKLVSYIVPELSHDDQLVVICGTNKRLEKKMKRSAKGLSNVLVVGYTHQIHLYMSASDLFLSKPGGLSSTEAFRQHLPFIAIDIVPGCETRNIEFFKRCSLVESTPDLKELADLAMDRLHDSEYLEKASNRIKELFPGNSTKEICDHIIADNNKKVTENK